MHSQSGGGFEFARSGVMPQFNPAEHWPDDTDTTMKRLIPGPPPSPCQGAGEMLTRGRSVSVGHSPGRCYPDVVPGWAPVRRLARAEPAGAPVGCRHLGWRPQRLLRCGRIPPQSLATSWSGAGQVAGVHVVPSTSRTIQLSCRLAPRP